MFCQERNKTTCILTRYIVYLCQVNFVYNPMKKGEIKMNVYGVNVDIKTVPELDPTFVPLHVFNREFLKTAKKPSPIGLS